MTATEKLRQLLDERGVGYSIDDGKTVCATKWKFGECSSALFTEYDDGERVFVTSEHNWTPEQAIAATLGERVFEVEWRENGYGTRTRHCGGCGADLDCDTRNRQHYCPNCGAKVVE